MSKTISYQTHGTCSRKIDIAINEENDTIETVKFTAGCDGNTTGIERLVQGMKVSQAISLLKGIRCGVKSTSCPDQLALALEKLTAEK